MVITLAQLGFAGVKSNADAQLWVLGGLPKTNLHEVRPIFIDEYLKHHGAHGEVRIRTGAWNTGWHNGIGFTQWTGSRAQMDALHRVALTSEAFLNTRQRIQESAPHDADLQRRLAEAHWRLLRAETSCHFYWGEAWIPRCHSDLEEVWSILNRLNAR